MKTLVRAGLVLIGAIGLSVALSSIARAEVVDPGASVQPAAAELEEFDPLSGRGLLPLDGPMFWTSLESRDEVVATPAPEQVVRPAPARGVQHGSAEHSGSALDRAVRDISTGSRVLGSYLGRVVDACQTGLASGAGGPVLALAVLSLAVAFTGRGAQRARGATDEDAPEFLYAWGVIAPG